VSATFAVSLGKCHASTVATGHARPGGLRVGFMPGLWQEDEVQVEGWPGESGRAHRSR
jgi:hypothetical protein